MTFSETTSRIRWRVTAPPSTAGFSDGPSHRLGDIKARRLPRSPSPPNPRGLQQEGPYRCFADPDERRLHAPANHERLSRSYAAALRVATEPKHFIHPEVGPLELDCDTPLRGQRHADPAGLHRHPRKRVRRPPPTPRRARRPTLRHPDAGTARVGGQAGHPGRPARSAELPTRLICGPGTGTVTVTEVSSTGSTARWGRTTSKPEGSHRAHRPSRYTADGHEHPPHHRGVEQDTHR